jgi:hypothetical protein
MTVTCQGVHKNGQIHILDKDKLGVFKRGLGEGQVVWATWTDDEPHSSGALRYWHALRDRYADTLGYGREEAKVELKVLCGTSLTLDEMLESPPEEEGRIVEYHSERYWLRSLREYTKDELKALTDRTKHACWEAQVPIDDLVAEHE